MQAWKIQNNRKVLKIKKKWEVIEAGSSLFIVKSEEILHQGLSINSNKYSQREEVNLVCILLDCPVFALFKLAVFETI